MLPKDKKKQEKYHEITDLNGNKIKLYEHTIEHIKRGHSELGDVLEFVTKTLKEPIFITEDELPNTVIYHRSIKKPLMSVAYIETEKSIVKSAHISDTVKGGKVIWFNPPKDLLK